MRNDIFLEISNERDYQDTKWGQEFDDNHTIDNWNGFINMYLSKAAKMGVSKDIQRTALLKAVTIGVAALEAFDRNGCFAPRHYDGEDQKC